MTWGECLALGTEILTGAGVPDADTDARLLLETFCDISRSSYYLRRNEEMPADAQLRYREVIKKRCLRIPLQYLTGEQEFMGLRFSVTPDVLIPRQDTETLAEEALNVLKDAGRARVLDLCTGSGCLAVSIKHYFPAAEVDASDIFAAALEVAARNARENRADITFLESDLFSGISGTYDLIVSNPPYIPSGEIEGLMPEVRDFEPRAALDGSPDGLYFYRIIIGDSPRFLKPGGTLLFEIGKEQGDSLRCLLADGGFEAVRIIKDLAGNDRVAAGTWRNLYV